MTDEPLSPEAEETQAVDRIARSRDGHLLHRYLRRVLEGVIGDMPDAGALMSQNGRRSLARDLMRLMAPGIEQTSGRHANASDPILARPGKPAEPRHARGARRRVTADTLVPGWNVAGDGVDPAAKA